MVFGTLRPEKFQYYTIIDFLYLKRYIALLETIKSRAAAPSIKGFLQKISDATNEELETVHLAALNKYHISDEKILRCQLPPGIEGYIQYMEELAVTKDMIDSLTALLNCSWVYAYLAENLTKQYKAAIRRSPYRAWFAAYTAPEYLHANQDWINMVNSLAEGLCNEKLISLCRIFETCARFEHGFWDIVYCLEG